MLAIGVQEPHHLVVEKRFREGPEIIRRLNPDEIDQLIWQKTLALGNHRAGLAAARRQFYDFELFVEGQVQEINDLRAQRNLEPIPSEVILELQALTTDSPEDLSRLDRRIVDVERLFRGLMDAEAALGEYRGELVKKREELLGGQESQDLVDEEGRPDQSL